MPPTVKKNHVTLLLMAWAWPIFLLSGAPTIGGDVLSARDAFTLASRNKIILIDIRSESEWRETGIASVARPVSMHGPQFLSTFRAMVAEANGRPIALMCATGGRSAWLQKELSRRGMRNIANVAEGMLGSAAGPGWLGSGLPVVSYTAASSPSGAQTYTFWERITGWYKPLWINDK